MDHRRECLCPTFCRAIDILGRRWTCLIVSLLLESPRRFSELEHGVPGIGGRMLSERLKALEAQGIVERQIHDQSSSKIEYCLTAKGHGLESALREIEVWADKWEPVPATGTAFANVRSRIRA